MCPVRTAERIDEMRELLAGARRAGARVALVPTMGYLHEGHLRLVDAARGRAAVVVMSIFVNPLQFGPSEDYAQYPRDPAGDAAKAESRGVNILFTPAVDEMYRGPRDVMVVPSALAAAWEGAARPGHFAGVLTVVAKLFNIVQPDVAVFGRKDLQQTALVRAMVRDLDFPVEVAVVPTVRADDGLALSSRNSYLGSGEREQALALPRALEAIREAFADGERAGATLEGVGRTVLQRARGVDVEYLALVDPVGLRRVERADAGDAVIVAARVGGTRLIDNVILEAP